VDFVRLRKHVGLTQVQAAAGIISQSMMCQLERGRIIPSVQTIERLANRYSVESGAIIAGYEPWRSRFRVRDRLWESALQFNTQQLEATLRQFDMLLLPCEMHMYRAFGASVKGQLDVAHMELYAAWEHPGLLLGLNGQSAENRFSSQSQNGGEGAWRKTDRGRMLVLEADTQIQICEHTERFIAADRWRLERAERFSQVQDVNLRDIR